MTSVKPRPSAAPAREGPSEYEILKLNHRFLRDEDGQPPKEGQDSWDETLARKFYSNLWKEYAICDLKHYKSGNFSLRWRTEDEVVSGAGESTCGNTRCKYHEPSDALPSSSSRYGTSKSDHRKREAPKLRTLELPFGYTEQGQAMSALVKVVLCERCVKKIMWRREQIKRNAVDTQGEPDATRVGESADVERSRAEDGAKRKKPRSPPNHERHRSRRSRSCSPDGSGKRDKRRD